MADEGQSRVCDLCGRPVAYTTKHHLIPRALHGRRRFRRMYTKEYMISHVLWLCRPCHSTVHKVLSERELGLVYNTREKLLSEPTIRRFVDWLSEKPAGFKPAMRSGRGPK